MRSIHVIVAQIKNLNNIQQDTYIRIYMCEYIYYCRK
jgi:hypothetical protein